MTDSESKRIRTQNACERCKKRKRKCDGHQPCRGCKESSNECEYIPRGISEVFSSKYQILKQDNSSLQQQLTLIQQQLEHLKQESLLIRKENTQLRSQVVSNEIIKRTPQYVINTEEPAVKLSESIFTDVLSNLMFKTNDEMECIGSFAVITIVQVIKRILQGDDYVETPPIIIDETIDETDTVSKKLENDFLYRFFSLAHNRCYFFDEIWFKDVLEKRAVERDEWEHFAVNIAFAIGCRLTQLSNGITFLQPESYFRKALVHLAKAKMDPLRQIQGNLLIAVFISRSYYLSFYVSAWDLIGSAMRKLIQFGYHRKMAITRENSWNYEVIKRIFWSAYNHDKLLALSLGRPSSVVDNFIDIPFPVSFELPDKPTEADMFRLYELQMQQESDPGFTQLISPFTTVIATTEIRMIESRVHLLLYSVNNFVPIADTFESLQQEIDKWYNKLPARESFEAVMKGRESYDFLDLLYYRARLILLLPTIIKSSQRDQLLDQACLAAGRICTSYQKLHSESILEFSILALHTVFLAGITMVYYLNFKGEPDFINIRHDLRVCSNLLYIFTERWKEAKTYHSIFDNILDEMENKSRGSISLETPGMTEDFWDAVLSSIQKHV